LFIKATAHAGDDPDAAAAAAAAAFDAAAFKEYAAKLRASGFTRSWYTNWCQGMRPNPPGFWSSNSGCNVGLW